MCEIILATDVAAYSVGSKPRAALLAQFDSSRRFAVSYSGKKAACRPAFLRLKSGYVAVTSA